VTVKYKIDVQRAKALRKEGLSWQEVGTQLAKEIGRPIRFTREGVTNAIREAAAQEKENES